MAIRPRPVNLSNTARKAVDSAKAELKGTIKAALQEIAANPLIGVPLKGEFKGLRRFRVGKYRIVYLLTDQSIEVVNIAHRKDVYR